ncbi:hypothetical protein FN3523_0010 [Francisella hispaniensis]|uniref:Uncharacterized protein n=1 Tax=Francisella hispaniensis TaxID=622488 RepID=F4BI73_9GAMM|nr:hypothetical protein FN3523_0010 [Francisella hispaniensis]
MFLCVSTTPQLKPLYINAFGYVVLIVLDVLEKIKNTISKLKLDNTIVRYNIYYQSYLLFIYGY